MARKNKTPKAPKIPKEKVPTTPFDKQIKKALAITLAAILIFTAGNFLGSLKYAQQHIKINQIAGEITNATVATQAPTSATTEAATQAPTQAPSESAGADTSQQSTTAPASQGSSSAAPQTKAEIIEVFNKAANAVKTDAKSVTRNFKKQQHLSEYTVLPSVAQSIGSGLIDTFLKDSTEVKVYDTPELIKEKFPVENETWSSKATEADITEATCTDDGTNYNITLKFVEGTDPNGTGVANAFSCLTLEDIKEAASMVETASFKYFDAVIECKVDKATGQLIWANYHLPMVLSVDAKIVVSVSGSVGMMFEWDYSIAY